MMKRFLSFMLAAVLLFAVPYAARAALDEEQVLAADAYFGSLFTRTKAVNGAVLVAQGGQRIYAYYMGYVSRARERAVDDGTVYKVASVSKLISAIGVMQLAERGKLNLDAPLVSASGNPIRNPYHPDADITLRQAMSHTTSILGDAPYAGTPKWEQVTRDENKYFSRAVPGSKYEYANLNGGILCSAVERASGQNFNRYMMENVFSPLNINASYAAHLLPDPTALSATYRANGTVYLSADNYLKDDAESYDDTCDPDRHYRTSIGSLYISLAGLEKLGSALASAGQADGKMVLSLASVREMRADQSTVKGSTVTGSSPYGLCLYRYTAQDGKIWYGHQGRWEGLLVDVFVEPETETVLVLVMNGVSRRPGTGEMDTRAEQVINYISDWTAWDMISFVVEE